MRSERLGSSRAIPAIVCQEEEERVPSSPSCRRGIYSADVSRANKQEKKSLGRDKIGIFKKETILGNNKRGLTKVRLFWDREGRDIQPQSGEGQCTQTNWDSRALDISNY